MMTSGILKVVAVLGLGVVVREAYNTCILQFWHLSIDMHFILSYVEFENGLSISVSKNKAACHKKSTTRNRKVSKKNQLRSKTARPVLFQEIWCTCMSELPRKLRAYTKE
jgi:hypothetical protein